jgi:hypothetical protein
LDVQVRNNQPIQRSSQVSVYFLQSRQLDGKALIAHNHFLLPVIKAGWLSRGSHFAGLVEKAKGCFRMLRPSKLQENESFADTVQLQVPA